MMSLSNIWPRKIDLFIYLILFSLIFQNRRILIFGVWIDYLNFLILIFVAYYIFFDIKNLRELLECKSLVSSMSIIFLIAIISQFQSFYIDFPITTIRQSAILNYPLLKGLTRLLQLFVLFLFSLCIVHYAKKDNFIKLITMAKFFIGYQ